MTVRDGKWVALAGVLWRQPSCVSRWSNNYWTFSGTLLNFGIAFLLCVYFVAVCSIKRLKLHQRLWLSLTSCMEITICLSMVGYIEIAYLVLVILKKKKKKAATITDNENPSEALSFTDPLWSQHRDGKIWKKTVWFKPFQVPAAQLQMVYLMFYSSQKLRGLTFSNRGGKVELVWGWRTKSYAVCSIKRKHADAVLKTYMYNTESIWMRGGPTVSLWDQQGNPESDPWKG